MNCKVFAFCLALCLGPLLHAQQFTASGLQTEFQYYGPPLEAKVGYLFRKDNLSFFSYVGGQFNAGEIPHLNSIAGVNLQKGWFLWKNQFAYELLPAIPQGNANILHGTTTPGFHTRFGSLQFPLSAGKRRYPLADGSWQPYLFISGQVRVHAFLLDTGQIRSTLVSALEFSRLPKTGYNFYSLSLHLPITVSFDTFEVGTRYTSLYFSDLPGQAAVPPFQLGATYSQATARQHFTSTSDPRYRLLQLMEVEPRFYPFRYRNPYSEWFLSAFGNIGLGVTATREVNLLYQVGGGAGFNLFDSVPFTIQVGIDQNKQCIIFIGVVSNVSHIP